MPDVKAPAEPLKNFDAATGEGRLDLA